MKFPIVYGILLAGQLLSSQVLYAFDGYINWLKRTFRQADILPHSCYSARSFLQSIAAYDHFATVVLIDALMVSDEVLATYTALYARRRGWLLSQEQDIFRQEKKNNEKELGFYILITPAQRGSTLSTTPDAWWALSLVIDEVSYQPMVVQPCFLLPEYQEIFGRRFSHFRDAYYVSFPLGHKNRDRIVNQAIPIKLMFCSAHYVIELYWS
jgi:hypothetical protein